MRIHAGYLFAALVTAVGYQTDIERKLEMEKSQFLQNIEKMLDAVKRGEQLELVYPDDLEELC